MSQSYVVTKEEVEEKEYKKESVHGISRRRRRRKKISIGTKDILEATKNKNRYKRYSRRRSRRIGTKKFLEEKEEKSVPRIL